MHSAVWTGSFMLIWGGKDLNTGGRYALGQSTDDDGDGFSECDGDCNDTNAGAFAVPPEIQNVHWLNATTLAWNSSAPASGSGTSHDVVRGLVSQLPVGTGPAETCFATGQITTALDSSSPPPSGAFWYLVRGRNVCGRGGYGFTSAGPERITGACP